MNRPTPEQATSEVDDYYNIPFNPQGNIHLDNMTISLNASHYSTTPEEREENIEWNMHSLYGTM